MGRELSRGYELVRTNVPVEILLSRNTRLNALAMQRYYSQRRDQMDLMARFSRSAYGFDGNIYCPRSTCSEARPRYKHP